MTLVIWVTVEPRGGIEPPTPFLPRTCSTAELSGPVSHGIISPLAEVVEGVGFEPTNSFRRPDLQSGGFNRSPTPPGIPRLPAGEAYAPESLIPRKASPAGMRWELLQEPQRGLEPLTCRLQVDRATIAPQGHLRSLETRHTRKWPRRHGTIGAT